MVKDSTLVVIGNMSGYLYFLDISSNNVVNLASTRKRNANKNYHKFREKSQVRIENKVEKYISKGKIWIPKLQQDLQYQKRETPPRNVRRWVRKIQDILVVSNYLHINGGEYSLQKKSME